MKTPDEPYDQRANDEQIAKARQEEHDAEQPLPYVYVASSWRCPKQPEVVQALKLAGFPVYDFKHPSPGDNGFHWSEIDPAWQKWDGEHFRSALNHPVARKGYAKDIGALQAARIVVLVLPCGRSAHLELGYGCGAGKRTIVLLDDQNEPELMYRMVDYLCLTVEEVVEKALRLAALEGVEL